MLVTGPEMPWNASGGTTARVCGARSLPSAATRSWRATQWPRRSHRHSAGEPRSRRRTAGSGARPFASRRVSWKDAVGSWPLTTDTRAWACPAGCGSRPCAPNVEPEPASRGGALALCRHVYARRGSDPRLQSSDGQGPCLPSPTTTSSVAGGDR